MAVGGDHGVERVKVDELLRGRRRKGRDRGLHTNQRVAPREEGERGIIT
tara:strand:+ start:880 stop:1026 length:147 start_codon:yes stop_codon:yes gene_type:complete